MILVMSYEPDVLTTYTTPLCRELRSFNMPTRPLIG